MNKYFSLLKASMSEGMNLFRVSTKSKNNTTKVILPIFLTIVMMSVVYSYAEGLIVKLQEVNMEFVALTIFILVTSILTLVEGIYKSGNLLFNCKDDNLLLSLPIKKSTVLFIRVFKFYLFEFLYNSLFLVPAMISYAVHMKPSATFYIVSLIGVLVFPIIPILISCAFGTIITFIASKFKGKNIAQTVITIIFVLGIMYVSFNMENLLKDIVNSASNINDMITKIYYPAGAYINLVMNFNILKLLEFLFINVALFIVTIALIGKVYFNINSSVKSIKTKNSNNGKYVIKTASPMKALIKKEFSRFVNSPVFITNACFGLVLYVIGCILLVVKFDGLVNIVMEKHQIVTVDFLLTNIPIMLLALICFSSFSTSITSSMISLEGKSFNILKSLPVKPYTIIKSKVLAAIIMMIPCFIVGDLIVFIRFKLDILSMILLLFASFLFPVISETIGIIVNLKYPRMDAKNDTEVVKQSMSSTISVFIGMALIGLTSVLLFKAVEINLTPNIILAIFVTVYLIIYLGLSIYLHKTCEKNFNNITI